MILSLSSVNFLEQLTELRETCYLPDYWFTMKAYNSGIAIWKRCRGQHVGKGLWARLSPSTVLNTDWTTTLCAVSGWAGKWGFVGSGSWEMQGHILLQHSWVLGLRMRSDCVSFWMYTLLSHVSFILRQAVYVGPRQPPAAHDQVLYVQVIPTKFSEFSSIFPALYFMPSPGPNSVTLMVETRVTHPPLSERAGVQEFETGTWMEYGQEAAAAQSRSSREERPHIQGQRNPSKTVGTERGHQRADRLKPQSQKTGQSDHRTAVVSNSVKLSHALWGHQRWSGHDGEVWQNVANWKRE